LPRAHASKWLLFQVACSGSRGRVDLVESAPRLSRLIKRLPGCGPANAMAVHASRRNRRSGAKTLGDQLAVLLVGVRRARYPIETTHAPLRAGQIGGKVDRGANAVGVCLLNFSGSGSNQRVFFFFFVSSWVADPHTADNFQARLRVVEDIRTDASDARWHSAVSAPAPNVGPRPQTKRHAVGQ